MDVDPTSFSYTPGTVPGEVVNRYLTLRTDAPQAADTRAEAPAPQIGPAMTTLALPPGSPRTMNGMSASPVMQQRLPAASDQTMPERYAQWPAVSPSGSADDLEGGSGIALAHDRPHWRARVQPLADSTDSDEDMDGDSMDDCIASLIHMARRSDRLEREASWEAAMPPLANALVRLSFKPSSVRDVVLAEAASLLTAGHDVCDTDPAYGRSVLHWVCLLGDAAIVDFVLASGGSRCVNDRDACGYLPLSLVCQLRSLPERRNSLPDASGIAAILIRHGARLGELPSKGGELLFLPDLTPSLAATVVAAGINIDSPAPGLGTPLSAACLRGNWTLAEWLLDAGASARARGRFRTSLLHHSAMPEWLAKLVLARGANPNARDITGQTPLMSACEADNLPLVRLLLQHGAIPEAADHDSHTVLDYAEAAGPEFAKAIREALMLQSSVKLADS